MMKPELPKSFNELINSSETPVLVDFYADWCAPCKMVTPVIKRIAGEYKGKLTAIKINTEKKPRIAGQYQITSIPTIMMFYKGKSVMRLTGAHPYESLKRSIEKNWPVDL